MRKAIITPILALTILLSTFPSLYTAIGDDAGSVYYIVLENTYIGNTCIISVVNSAGARAVIWQAEGWLGTQELAIDSSGNYILASGNPYNPYTLLKVTPTGEMTVIYTFSAMPIGMAIDSSGNCIICERANILSKVTPDGVRTVINSEVKLPFDVAIDSSGNYIVTELYGSVLSRVTPTGERTVIYTFPNSPYQYRPIAVAIDSSGNYIVTESPLEVAIEASILLSNYTITVSNNPDELSRITPTGERTVIYTFPAGTEPMGVAIDSSGNYIVCEYYNDVLSRITPTGERTVIYTFPTGTWPIYVIISTAPELLFVDVAENGLRATWTQSAKPSFAGYQLYQSTTQGQLGTLIGTNTDVADTSLTVTGLSPWTTYYFTLRVLSANGTYVDYGQRSMTTAKSFWQEDWFARVIFVVVIIIAITIVFVVLYFKYKKRARIA